MKDKTLTDILVICKGWYNKALYNNPLEAMNAYYHKYYGCEDIMMEKAFAEYLFLRPLALEAIKIKPVLARYIFEPQFSVLSNKEPFAEVMYDRLMGLIQMIEHGMFDLSEYEDMFAKAKACNYEDETIGIIWKNRGDCMTITEILNIIHEERVELEVFEALHKWMISDRAEWTSRAMDAEATLRAVGKMAKENKNTKNAIKGIVDICDSALED